LRFAYGSGAKFSCLTGSSLDYVPAECAGSQKGAAYTLAIVAPQAQSRVVLKGKAGDALAKATYKGPKGKLRIAKVPAALQAASAPVSQVVLSPVLSAQGKLGGTGFIHSAYSGQEEDAPLTGSIKKGKVKWALKNAAANLSFAGKEQGGAWIGTLKGKIGPDAIALPNFSISLAPLAYALTVQTAGSGSGQVASAPPGIDCPGACAAPFAYQTEVALTATPAAGSSFAGWGGDQGCESGKPVMNAPRACIATFNLALGADARFHGTVSSSDGLSGSTPAGGVKVTLRSDLNGNSTIDPGEAVTTQTDTAGQFEQRYPVVEGRAVTVDFDLDGYSKTPKVFASISPGADVPINTALRKLDEVPVNEGRGSSSDGKLQLEKLPATVESLSGRTFNPVTETAQFPGEFADSTGKMLISSVFSDIEAKDKNGAPVTNLAEGAKLRMQVPADTWNTLRDLVPGNGHIDVPLYYYDKAAGQWMRSASDGWLEDEAGAALPESALPAIKDGSYPGALYAAGEIKHLSYWNIDWPVETHGCVAGRIVDSTGRPVAGAVVTAKGVTYTGSSAPVSTQESGRFCIDVMRSEGPDEDLNDNGARGEPSRISLTAYANGKYYQLGAHTVPISPATCALGGCLELGDIALDASREVVVSLCAITGSVVYSGIATGGDPGLIAGAPIANATVYAYDANTDLYADCLANGQCAFFASTDENGRFSLKIPVLLAAELIAYQFNANPANPTDFRFFVGNQSTEGCPASPITIKADAYSFSQ
jgi:hypothetical protein